MPYSDPEVQKEYQRQWMASRRAYFFQDKVCVGCGSAENLELDHKERSKKVSHRIWSWTKARRDSEIAKCQVLCEVCHSHKTAAENSTPIVHGTKYAYDVRGCRCEECKTNYATRRKAWPSRQLLTNQTL